MDILFGAFITLAIIALLCAEKNNGTRDIKTSLFIIISFITLLFFRTCINIDSLPDLPFYNEGYIQIRNSSFRDALFGTLYDVKIPEIGFRAIMKLVSYISGNFSFFLFCYGIIWLVCYYKVILKYSNYISISIIILFVECYTQSLFVLRQHLAICLVFLSYRAIIERSQAECLLLVLIACLMHQTAIIVLPLYYLYGVKSKNRLTFTLVVSGIILYISFAILLSFVGNTLIQDYMSYVDSDIKANYSGVIIILILFIPYILCLKEHIWDNGINRLLFITLALGLIFLLCGVGYNPTSRLAMYFSNVAFLSIPKTMSYIRNPVLKYGYLIMYLILATYITFWGSSSDSLINYELANQVV